jgi:hypothetical protein
MIFARCIARTLTFLALGMMTLAVACSDDDKGNAGQGDRCGSTEDCERPLLCLASSQTCWLPCTSTEACTDALGSGHVCCDGTASNHPSVCITDPSPGGSVLDPNSPASTDAGATIDGQSCRIITP